MLRSKPKLKYCGLTVVLSQPSRFDKLNLLSANGGCFFNQDCLRPEFNSMQCDIRVTEDKSPWIDGTHCILLTGTKAMHDWLPECGGNTLNEMRGSPFYINDIPTICSFSPQDCVDLKNYEEAYNEAEKTDNDTDGDDEEEGDVKSHSRTKRSNYAFWFKSDIRKVKELLRSQAKVWPIEQQPEYRIYPSADEVINVLESNHDKWMDFDIETDYEEQNLLCFAFTFNGYTVYSVPVLNTNYQPAYSSLSFIIRSLVKAIESNILVAHNGAAFDFLVLGYKYHIPVYRVYDTMIAFHRCFPDVEQSLGHCMSYWTYQKFHKDTNPQSYRTTDDMIRKLKYCAKDVFGMHLVRKAIQKYEVSIPGLSDSIRCANDSICPYLICTLQGIKYSEARVKELCGENDKLMMQYLRIINMLIGPTGLKECLTALKSGKSKSSIASSNAQCCDYFHRQLGYPVVFRSKQTGKPSLGKKVMYKLALKHDNPVITFINLYRKVQKEYSNLSFIPWRDNDGKVVDIERWLEQ